MLLVIFSAMLPSIGLAMVVGLPILLQRDYCPICMSHVLAMRMYPRRNSSACGHRCCAPCWRLFFSTQERSLIHALRRVRASSALCCWGCDAMLDSGVVRKFASRALNTVAAQVAKREEYEQRAQRFNFQCVDCPECSIGVGYNDYSQRTIMCFLCEHQWEAERGWDLGAIIAGWVSAWWPLRPAGLAGSRPCPHCGANIQKDGGCPMMCAVHPASRGAAHAASSLAPPWLLPVSSLAPPCLLPGSLSLLPVSSLAPPCLLSGSSLAPPSLLPGSSLAPPWLTSRSRAAGVAAFATSPSDGVPSATALKM